MKKIINSMQKAIVVKDVKGFMSNKRLRLIIIIVPLILSVFLPSVYILSTAFIDDPKDIITMIPSSMRQGDLKLVAINIMLNSSIPMLFLLTPLMASSVMASSAFVGEKEKSTLETLLYSPLSLKEIFNAKVLASFIVGMAVSFIAFVMMVVAIEAEFYIIFKQFFALKASWFITLLFVAPATALFSIALIVLSSAKAQTVEEAQQKTAFLIMPFMLLVVSQFTGLFLVNNIALIGLGIVLWLLALLLMQKSSSRFTYESLLNDQ